MSHSFPPNPQSATPFLAALQAAAVHPASPFYTPGHKRGQGISDRLAAVFGKSVFQADLPDLPGFNLFDPEGTIAAAQRLAAEAFGAEQTWFLINGSTCGVIAAILATCQPGDKIILPRNVHQSAISGLILADAQPLFVLPEYDPGWDLTHCLTPEAITHALEQHPDAKAVLLVSPTYHGVCADVAAIGQIAHSYDIPLIVDEAHGAHFAFHPALPTPALAAGADLVVQSTHKVLAAMTQASMLHCQGSRVDRRRISQTLQLLQSSSPSNVLLASLDAARQQMATEGKALMAQTLALADQARSRLQQIPGLSVLSSEQTGTPGFQALDRTRLTVKVSGLSIDGFTADEILHDQLHVTAELPTLQHLTFIISLGNTQQDIDRLVNAFATLAQDYRGDAGTDALDAIAPVAPPGLLPDFMPEVCLTSPLISLRQAFFSPSQTVPLSEAIGCISAETLCPYPPGIPVLLAGEPVTEWAIETLQQILAAGGLITGCADPTLQSLRVVSRQTDITGSV